MAHLPPRLKLGLLGRSRPSTRALYLITTLPAAMAYRSGISLLKVIAPLVVFFAAVTADASAQTRPVPDAVTRYVEARNYAAAFSVPRERAYLTSFSSLATVQDSVRSERLIEVWQHLRQTKSFEMEVDSDINSLWDKRQANPIPPELLRVQNVKRRGEKSLVVEALAYRLDRTANRELVLAYDQGTSFEGPEARVPDDLFPQPGRPVVQRWTKARGGWKKESADFRYLETPPR